MKKLFSTLFLLLHSFYAICTSDSGNTNITFYEVPLVCGAAPQIGCGSKSKPVLLQFEDKNDVVSEAWLNRAGTVIAIVWSEKSTSELRISTANSIFQENKMNVITLEGKKHKKLVVDFQKKENWYRGTNVDKLSMEEAEIIAVRLVSRIDNITKLTEDKKAALKNEFSIFFKNCFTKNYGSEINAEESKTIKKFKTNYELELSTIAKKYLNETEIAAFNDAVKQGLKPDKKEAKKLKGCCSSKK